MEEKKKGKGSVIVIILLIIVILGLVGYICYDKGIIFKSEPKKVEKEIKLDVNKNSEESISLSDSRFTDIYNSLKEYSYIKNRENGYKSFDDVELGTIGAVDLASSDFTKTDEVVSGVRYYLINSDSIINNLKKYFSSDVQYDYSKLIRGNERILIPSTQYLDDKGCIQVSSYDTATKNYKVQIYPCGWTSGPQAKVDRTKLVSASIKNDDIVVEEKAIYYKSEYIGNEKVIYTIYSDSNKTNVIDTKEYSIDEVNNVTISVDAYLDKASTITYTFKLNKDTNKYYFVSSIIK